MLLQQFEMSLKSSAHPNWSHVCSGMLQWDATTMACRITVTVMMMTCCIKPSFDILLLLQHSSVTPMTPWDALPVKASALYAL